MFLSSNKSERSWKQSGLLTQKSKKVLESYVRAKLETFFCQAGQCYLCAVALDQKFDSRDLKEL